LPAVTVSFAVISIPTIAFPETTFLLAGEVPPTKVPAIATSMPRPFGWPVVPSALSPIKQPSILLPLPPRAAMATPPVTKKGFR
jgi:hypothetical protein